MIQVPLTKLLFFDIETVGLYKDYNGLEQNHPALTKQFHNYFDWFQKRFPEDQGLDPQQVFVNRAALVPEFSKIVCASFAFVGPDGKTHVQTFSGDDEKEILLGINSLLNKVFNKRMVINGIKPSPLLPSYDTKPWEIKAIDTMDVWKMGNNFALSSLELMCAAMGVKSPKEGEVTGNRVHEAYYDFNQLDLIVEYCERDVMVLIDLIKKLKELQ
jgi:hypothetical protein